MTSTRLSFALHVAFSTTLVGVFGGTAHAQPMSTSPEIAYDLGEVPNARSVAMAGALTALGVSTPALAINPANMPMARVYHIEATGAFSPEAKRQSYGLSVVDSVLNSSRLAGGLLGMWSEIDPQGIHRTWTDLRGALALPLGDRLAFGATARWIRVEQAVGAGPFGSSPASDGTPNDPILNTLTFDVGATATIIDGLRVGVVGHNLTNPGTALAPTTGSAGVGYGNDTFALEADGLLDFTTYGSVRGRVMAGGEIFVMDRYAIRAGWRYDGGTRVNTASVGFGYIDPRWGVELGVRRDLIADHGSTFGVLSLRYFYDSTGSTTQADQPDAL
jgi:hypothetical protein